VGFEVEPGARHEMVLELVAVLDELDPEKAQTQDDGQDQVPGEGALPADLGRPNGEGHGQAAGDQHRGVDATKDEIQLVAPEGELVGVAPAVEEVRQEDTAIPF